jgi:hypothetical protein
LWQAVAELDLSDSLALSKKDKLFVVQKDNSTFSREAIIDFACQGLMYDPRWEYLVSDREKRTKVHSESRGLYI